jgi:hypothetical protein
MSIPEIGLPPPTTKCRAILNDDRNRECLRLRGQLLFPALSVADIANVARERSRRSKADAHLSGIPSSLVVPNEGVVGIVNRDGCLLSRWFLAKSESESVRMCPGALPRVENSDGPSGSDVFPVAKWFNRHHERALFVESRWRIVLAEHTIQAGDQLPSAPHEFANTTGLFVPATETT